MRENKPLDPGNPNQRGFLEAGFAVFWAERVIGFTYPVEDVIED
jgi:hypothetical protein